MVLPSASIAATLTVVVEGASCAGSGLASETARLATIPFRVTGMLMVAFAGLAVDGTDATESALPVALSPSKTFKRYVWSPTLTGTFTLHVNVAAVFAH